ncbi:MAG: hypothetical protein EHM59_06860 [Betaproteobacteria bacterium]|nr:MAG: hypothetical protein EHM59_06860 [Betaproteobacteria bacterium]
MPSEAILAAALEYLARGWSVIPIQARGKRPIVAWKQFEERAASEAEVRAWFERRVDANVGVVTGALSRIVVLDVDVAHDGAQSLAHLTAERGALSPTVEAITGGGGRHLYFAYPHHPVQSRVGIARGIDVRADGG